MAQQASKSQADLPLDRAADPKEANRNLFRPGYYRDEEGHRRLMSELGIVVDGGVSLEGAAVGAPAGDDRWPLYKTSLLVVGFSAAAWTAIVAAVLAID